ncbi:uncharacterized protein LOC135815793 [Sycon ciliatum]|eukprot:scpid42798/ scgid15581/ 
MTRPSHFLAKIAVLLCVVICPLAMCQTRLDAARSRRDAAARTGSVSRVRRSAAERLAETIESDKQATAGRYLESLGSDPTVVSHGHDKPSWQERCAAGRAGNQPSFSAMVPTADEKVRITRWARGSQCGVRVRLVMLYTNEVLKYDTKETCEAVLHLCGLVESFKSFLQSPASSNRDCANGNDWTGLMGEVFHGSVRLGDFNSSNCNALRITDQIAGMPVQPAEFRLRVVLHARRHRQPSTSTWSNVNTGVALHGFNQPRLYTDHGLIHLTLVPWLDLQQYILGNVTRAGLTLNGASQQPSGENVHSDRKRRSNPGDCRPKSANVTASTFNDLFPFRIVAPPMIEIGYCSGSCRNIILQPDLAPSLYHEVTWRHAVIHGSPMPHCLPVKFSKTALITHQSHSNGGTLMKHFADLKVIECHCS